MFLHGKKEVGHIIKPLSVLLNLLKIKMEHKNRSVVERLQKEFCPIKKEPKKVNKLSYNQQRKAKRQRVVEEVRRYEELKNTFPQNKNRRTLVT